MNLKEEELLKLYPDYTKVLGPYKRKDNRKHIVLNNSNLPKGDKNKTKTISYPKALVESNIGRKLLPNETIDHNDRDFTNDSESNLIIKDKALHSSEDALRVKVEPIDCPVCLKSFVPTVHQRNNSVGAGPFCSKSCVGIYRGYVGNGLKPIKRTELIKEYYRVEK
jgi:hypothetical protein